MSIYEQIEKNEISNTIDTLKQYGSEEDLANYYYELGKVYCRKYADIDKSNYYLKLAGQLFHELGNLEKGIEVKRNLGINQELIGNYDIAFSEFLECMNKAEEIGFAEGFEFAGGGICVLAHHLGNIDHEYVKLCRSAFKRYLDKYPDEEVIKEGQLLFEGWYNNHSSLLKDRVRAQLILEGLVENSKFQTNRYSAVHFLLVNYIEEMLTTGETVLLPKAMGLFEMLKKSMENNFILKIRFTILEAKLELVSGDLSNAIDKFEKILEVLESLRKSKILKRFVDEVNNELNDLKRRYKQWNILLQKNTRLGRLIEEDELEAFITNAKSLMVELD